MLETEIIEIDNISLEVSYYYEEGMESNDYDVPNDEPSIDIESIKIKGVDAYDILAGWVLDKIKETIINNN